MTLERSLPGTHRTAGGEDLEGRQHMVAGTPLVDDRVRVRAFLLCSSALFLLLAHAFIPIEEFIHRSDDAYYYFNVAVNFPKLGFWSFDSIHATNGVQPLWAIVLTCVAQLLASLGVTDVDLLARVFVACAAALQFVSSMILFHLLARHVSVG